MVVTLEHHNASDMIRRDSKAFSSYAPSQSSKAKFTTKHFRWHLHTGSKVARIFGKDKLHKVAQPAAFESFTDQAKPSVNF